MTIGITPFSSSSQTL